MLKKGMSLLKALILAVIIMLLAVVLANKIIDIAKNNVGDLLGGEEIQTEEILYIPYEVRPCTQKEIDADDPEANKRLVLNFARQESLEVPDEIVIALLEQESSFKHCDENRNVKPSPDKSSMGLGQIETKYGVNSTAATTCKGLDIYVREQNAHCMVKVLKNKFNVCGKSESAYKRIVINGSCETQSSLNHYFSYEGDEYQYHRALRCYNGVGCNPANADICYAEKILEKVDENIRENLEIIDISCP